MGSKGKRLLIKWIMVGLVIAVVLGISYYFLETYTVKTVYVEGNIHYTEDEIRGMVMEGALGNNSLYLSMKYKNKGVENIPFVDVMNVEVLSPDTIKIVVYEKALAGYIEFLDTYIYFDRDGYVVESSGIKTAGVPQIAGLSFDFAVLGEKLPVADEAVFESIMTITKLLSKYELNSDKIYFRSGNEIVLFFGDIRVALGKAVGLEDKIMAIPTFLEGLEGKKGTLRLENYSEEEKLTVFEAEDVM